MTKNILLREHFLSAYLTTFHVSTQTLFNDYIFNVMSHYFCSKPGWTRVILKFQPLLKLHFSAHWFIFLIIILMMPLVLYLPQHSQLSIYMAPQFALHFPSLSSRAAFLYTQFQVMLVKYLFAYFIDFSYLRKMGHGHSLIFPLAVVTRKLILLSSLST